MKYSRQMLRGKKLDVDCKQANYVKENWINGKYDADNEYIYCYGYIDMRTDELIDKCKECKAHIDRLMLKSEVSDE